MVQQAAGWKWVGAGVGRIVGKQSSRVSTYDCDSNGCSIGPDECDGLSEESRSRVEEGRESPRYCSSAARMVPGRRAMTATELGHVCSPASKIAAGPGDSKGRARLLDAASKPNPSRDLI